MENRDKEYERIKLLFEESLPELSSEKSFVAKVENGIQGIELVKANIKASKKGNKISALLSGMAGFLCGVILTLLYPFLNTLISSFIIGYLSNIPETEIISIVLTCIFISLICSGVSLGTYALFTQHRLLQIRTEIPGRR